MNEEWKYIQDSKMYMISNKGRVKSFKQNVHGTIMKNTSSKDMN